MTIISRIDETINNHIAAANIIAFGLLASISSISAAAINYSGQLTLTSYDIPTASAPAESKPIAKTAVSKAQTSSETLTVVSSPSNISPLALQSQAPNAVSQLQPAQGMGYSTQTATSLQPSTNNAQSTGANPQNAAGL